MLHSSPWSILLTHNLLILQITCLLPLEWKFPENVVLYLFLSPYVPSTLNHARHIFVEGSCLENPFCNVLCSQFIGQCCVVMSVAWKTAPQDAPACMLPLGPSGWPSFTPLGCSASKPLIVTNISHSPKGHRDPLSGPVLPLHSPHCCGLLDS